MAVTFTVNGVSRSYDDDREMPLLWYLRDTLGLKGAKFGCGIGECGACTVHVNGDAQRSCITPLDICEGAIVETIEQVSEGGLHPVQRAWIELDVAQCGYCQTGQVMAAIALLKKTPRPTDEDIDLAMTNICRCGTYNRIRAAIHRAAAEPAG